jgi:hypothetical protein
MMELAGNVVNHVKADPERDIENNRTFSTLYDESIDVFHYGDFPLSRKFGEIWKLILVGQWQLIISSWIWSSVHQILLLWLQTKLISHHLSNLRRPVILLTIS